MKKQNKFYSQRTAAPGFFALIFFLFAGGPMLAGSSLFQEQMTLAEILTELGQYRQGENDDLIVKLNTFIRSQRGDVLKARECERALVDFLDSGPSSDGLMEACRHLRVIGTELSLPVLEKMLGDAQTTDPARYALEKIPGPNADKILLLGLERSQGKILLGVISSVGQRKIQQAVPLLMKYIATQDTATAASAAAALGFIGTREAVEALAHSLPNAPPQLKAGIGRSLLRAVDSAFLPHSPSSAEQYYDRVLNENLPLSQKNAALQAKISGSREKGRGLILDVIGNNESEYLGTAVDMIPQCFSDSDLAPLLTHFDHLDSEYQVRFLNVLSHFQSIAACETAAGALKSPESSVRTAALDTLREIGGSSLVGLLIRHICQSKGLEQLAARRCLWELKDPLTDTVILETAQAEIPPDHQIECLTAVRERRIFQGRDLVLGMTQNRDDSVRHEALRTLRGIAQPGDIPALIGLLQRVFSERESEEIILTLAAAARRTARQSRQSDVITENLDTSTDVPTQAALIRVLGKLGDDSSLPLLRRIDKAADPALLDAYVRALAEWPTPAPREDLYEIAAQTDDLTHHILALRGFIRMIESDRFRLPEAAVHDLGKALELSRRIEEKWAVLGVLPRFACPQALLLAESLVKEKGAEKEAVIAVERIQEELEKRKKSR